MAPQAEIIIEDVQDKFIGNAIPIDVEGDPGNWCFQLTMNHLNDSIQGVPSKEAQEAFNKWRQNPLTVELLSYLNDQVQLHYRCSSPGKRPGYSANASAIKTRYFTSTIFQTADIIGNNYALSTSYFFVTERGLAVLTISRSEMLVLDKYLDPASNSYLFLNDYHRPATIQIGQN